MQFYDQRLFVGERSLFATDGAEITNSVFADGESPLKESRRISLCGCIFKWKYPLWYCREINVKNTTLLETARSGIWYTHGIEMTDCTIDAPKTFRRSGGITLVRCTLPYASETMWSCKDIKLSSVRVTGDYFAMNTENVFAEDLDISGNYAFDGAKNVEIHNARLISKDAFWNSENVTVYDSVIIGEYLGWNSKNLKLVNCTVESDQGMCYIDGIEMINCKVINTPLAFEYSKVNADITTKIDSVKNPASGRIKAPAIGELIMEESRVDTALTEIITEVGNE